MAIAIEDLIRPCPDCKNAGMVRGVRCATCNGQGHIRLAPEVAAAKAAPAEEVADGPIDPRRYNLPTLQALAQSLGLDITGTKRELAERINAKRAEEPASSAETEPAAS